VRFDGVRFVTWQAPNGQSHFPVYSLLTARDGSLWIGTGSKIAHLKDGRLLASLDSFGRVNGILEDSHGSLWIARSRIIDTGGPLCEVTGNRLRCYGKADGLDTPGVVALAEDREGNLWIGTSDGITRKTGNLFTAYQLKSLKAARGLSGVEALAAARDGSLWVGIGRRGPSMGLQRFTRDVWSAFVSPKLNGSSLAVSAVFVDRQNAVWVGTEDEGIYRICNGSAEHFSSADGLSGDAVTGFYEDRESNLWVSTSEGIDRFHDRHVVTFSTREGLGGAEVYSLVAARDGTIWMGNSNSLDSLHGGTVTSIDAKRGLPGHGITSLLEDHSGKLWVGVDNGLFLFDRGEFTPIRRRDGTPIGIVLGITEDHNHEVWAEVLQPPRLIRIKNRRVMEELSEPQMPAIDSLAADPEDGIWLGFVNGGLARYRHGVLDTFPTKHNRYSMISQLLVNSPGLVFGASLGGLVAWQKGQVQTLTIHNGLPCDGIYSLLSDKHGALWLNATCGVIRINDTEVQKWLEQPNTKVKTQLFDVLDGARPRSVPFSPHAARSPDGRLWFADETVVQMIDPDGLIQNTIPPPVHIEEALVDHKRYSSQNGVQLPPLLHNLQIDYTALSFVTPQRVMFRYKLEGHDPDWIDAGTRRQAFYNDLGPGRYRFRVIACNNDGLWNEAGATWEFSIVPAWFQTIWFRALCIVAGILMAWGACRVRVRQIARTMSIRFDERLAERTRMARELHDTFLQTIQGSKLVADDALENLHDPVRMRRALEQLSHWLNRAAQEGRAALQSLRISTVEANDLAAAFQRALEGCRRETSMAAFFSATGAPRAMHPIVRDEIYRIGYEAIRNACTHSSGNRIDVALSYADNLSLEIRDNGIGIDPAVADNGRDGHFGIQGMRERASRIGARLTIASSSNSGTAVRIVVPGGVVFQYAKLTPIEKVKAVLKRVIHN
jgi:signal transduction histidine kinase/ligand-binding sensor domain-containing protein